MAARGFPHDHGSQCLRPGLRRVRSAACFAEKGFDVVGVDVSESKVALINGGKATIVEEGIQELVAAMVAARRLRATASALEAVQATDISLVCVGTPSRPNGSLDLQYVERVCGEIGTAIAAKGRWHLVVIRSTVFPARSRNSSFRCWKRHLAAGWVSTSGSAATPSSCARGRRSRTSPTRRSRSSAPATTGRRRRSGPLRRRRRADSCHAHPRRGSGEVCLQLLPRTQGEFCQ